MGRIFLIENSLEGSGTHHFDLVECLVDASADLGLDISLGVNKRCDDSALRSLRCNSQRVFSATVYQPFSSLAGLRQSKRARALPRFGNGEKLSAFTRFSNWFRLRREQSRVEQSVCRFAQECAAFFADVELEEDDQVILATVSDLELLGALRFMAQTPRTIPATWSFIFHFGVFSGRPEQYAGEIKYLHPLQRRIAAELASLPYHRLQFLATTTGLVDQYSRLGLPGVRLFDYPVACGFSNLGRETATAKKVKQRLRFVVAGGVRREKGQQALLAAIAAEDSEFNRLSERVQLVVQTPKRPWWQKQKLSLGPNIDPQAIEFAEHPLPKEGYIDLIRSADCGVLMYDRNNYFCRRAGIFGEFAAACKPMIVSAGSWLGDQLDEPAQRYAEALLHQFPILNEVSPASLEWNRSNVPQNGGVWSYDGTSYPFEVNLELQPATGGIVMEYQWHFPKLLGTHCQWDLYVNGERKGLSRVTSFHQAFATQYVFFPTPFSQRQIRLALHNPTAKGTQSVHKVRVFELGRSVANLPISSVGLAVASSDQLGNAFAEIENQYAHYLSSAQEFGREWVRRHSPANSLRTMLSLQRRKQKTA